MDQKQHDQPTKGINAPTQEVDDKNQNQSNDILAPTNTQTQTRGPSVPSSYQRKQQYASQYMYQRQQHHLQQQLNNFWLKKRQEIEETTNFKTHSFPLARIKKIMKDDEDVKMVSAEATIVLAKACELFSQELTMRAWANAKVNKKRALQIGDIASAISKNDAFDFLVDIVPRDETIEQEVFTSIPKTESALPRDVPYYYMPPNHHVVGLPYAAPRMVMTTLVFYPSHNGQQTHHFPTPAKPTPKQQDNHSPDSDD